MEEHRLRLDDALAILRRRKGQAIVPAFILLAIAVLAALFIPPAYRSTAVLRVEYLEISVEPARTRSLDPIEQRLQTIARHVLTDDRLDTLIERHRLYPDIRRENREAAVARMRRHITLDMIGADIPDIDTGYAPVAGTACSLSFEAESATIAQTVAGELAALFLHHNRKQRAAAEQSAVTLQSATERLAGDIEHLQTRLQALERQGVDERAVRALKGDYEQALARYRELREQSLQADSILASSGEYFTLIEPPRLPDRPDAPNRTAILALGFVLAGAVGLGNLLLMERLDTRLYGRRAIESAAPFPLLAVVPPIERRRSPRAADGSLS